MGFSLILIFIPWRNHLLSHPSFGILSNKSLLQQRENPEGWNYVKGNCFFHENSFWKGTTSSTSHFDWWFLEVEEVVLFLLCFLGSLSIFYHMALPQRENWLRSEFAQELAYKISFFLATVRFLFFYSLWKSNGQEERNLEKARK